MTNELNAMPDINSTQIAAGEGGGQDNRLTINPNDFGGFAAEWEDGQTYQILVTVTQNSPGDFEVTDAVDKTGSAEETLPKEPEPGAEPAPQGEALGGAGYSNPAVSKLME